MSILKRMRNWWNAPTPEADPENEPEGEPQEIWQWQINCAGTCYDAKPMPKNFGLLIGTKADAEARLKADVSLPNHFKTHQRKGNGIILYEFYDPERSEGFAPPAQIKTNRCDPLCFREPENV